MVAIQIPLRVHPTMLPDDSPPGSFFRRGRSRRKRQQAILYCRRCGRRLLLRRNRQAHECRECRRLTGRLPGRGFNLERKEDVTR